MFILSPDLDWVPDQAVGGGGKFGVAEKCICRNLISPSLSPEWSPATGSAFLIMQFCCTGLHPGYIKTRVQWGSPARSMDERATCSKGLFLDTCLLLRKMVVDSWFSTTVWGVRSRSGIDWSSSLLSSSLRPQSFPRPLSSFVDFPSVRPSVWAFWPLALSNLCSAGMTQTSRWQFNWLVQVLGQYWGQFPTIFSGRNYVHHCPF